MSEPAPTREEVKEALDTLRAVATLGVALEGKDAALTEALAQRDEALRLFNLNLARGTGYCHLCRMTVTVPEHGEYDEHDHGCPYAVLLRRCGEAGE